MPGADLRRPALGVSPSGRRPGRTTAPGVPSGSPGRPGTWPSLAGQTATLRVVDPAKGGGATSTSIRSSSPTPAARPSRPPGRSWPTAATSTCRSPARPIRRVEIASRTAKWSRLRHPPRDPDFGPRRPTPPVARSLRTSPRRFQRRPKPSTINRLTLPARISDTGSGMALTPQRPAPRHGAGCTPSATAPGSTSPAAAGGSTTPTAWSGTRGFITCSTSTTRTAGTGGTCTGATPPAPTWSTGPSSPIALYPHNMATGRSRARRWWIGTIPRGWERTGSRRWSPPTPAPGGASASSRALDAGRPGPSSPATPSSATRAATPALLARADPALDHGGL